MICYCKSNDLIGPIKKTNNLLIGLTASNVHIRRITKAICQKINGQILFLFSFFHMPIQIRRKLNYINGKSIVVVHGIQTRGSRMVGDSAEPNFFQLDTPGLFFVNFRLYKLYNFYNKYISKKSIQYTALRFKPTTYRT